MFIFDALYPDRVVYSARSVDDELVDRIRADPGVEFVELNHAPPKLRLAGDEWRFDS